MAIALAACIGRFQISPPSAKKIFERSVPSVVRVDVDKGLGAGFVIDSSGLIVTNLHVVDDTPSARVIFRDGRTLPVARVRAFDDASDLAILEVAADDLPALRLGDSEALGVGDRLYAIGNPLGFDYSMSDGILSGLRELKGVPALQVSVAMAPGSSGGPILDERGLVVGIARGYVSAGDKLGIATPISALKALRKLSDSRPAQPFEEFAAARADAAAARAAAAEQRRAEEQGRAIARPRQIPNHPVAMLEGCSDQDLRRSVEGVVAAIEKGAPAYNDGDPEGCFRIYEQTARDLTEQLSVSCGGGRKALQDGLERAGGLDAFDDKAWALRDAFDGLIDVIGRRVVDGLQHSGDRTDR